MKRNEPYSPSEWSFRPTRLRELQALLRLQTSMTIYRSILFSIPVLFLISARICASAQTLAIPDAGLNSAIRSELELPSGPISAQDILRLINLDASRRNIRSTVGLEAARNLVSLNLEINGLTNFSVPST